MNNRKPDTQLAEAIRNLQKEIDDKAIILKALRAQYDPEEVDYYEYIKTEAWEEMRQKVFRRDGFQCVICKEAKNLNVHHITYERLGCEELADLVTLCQKCHEKVHVGNEVEKLLQARQNAIEAKEADLSFREEKIRDQEKETSEKEILFAHMNKEERALFATVILLGSEYKKLNHKIEGVYLENYFSLSSVVDVFNSGGTIEEYESSWQILTKEVLKKLPEIVYGEDVETITKVQLKREYIYWLCWAEWSQLNHFAEIEEKKGNYKKMEELKAKAEDLHYFQNHKLLQDKSYLEAI